MRHLSTILIALSLLSCAAPDPEELRAKEVLAEINGIAGKPVDPLYSQQLKEAMLRLHEAKGTFPNGRDQIMADARLGKEFFTSGIEGHRRIIALFQELSTMRLSEVDATCVQKSIAVQEAMIDSMDLTLNEISLFLDEDIKDKETLDSRSYEMRNKASVLKSRVDELTKEQKPSCSKSRLGIG